MIGGVAALNLTQKIAPWIDFDISFSSSCLPFPETDLVGCPAPTFFPFGRPDPPLSSAQKAPWSRCCMAFPVPGCWQWTVLGDKPVFPSLHFSLLASLHFASDNSTLNAQCIFPSSILYNVPWLRRPPFHQVPNSFLIVERAMFFSSSDGRLNYASLQGFPDSQMRLLQAALISAQPKQPPPHFFMVCFFKSFSANVPAWTSSGAVGSSQLAWLKF